jgi:hypothetical protein
MEQMSLTVLYDLPISTNNCLALLPYSKGLKIYDGVNTMSKQMDTEKRKSKSILSLQRCVKVRSE